MKGEEVSKRCCKCKMNCLTIIFYKNVNRKDGVNSMCKISMNKDIKGYGKNRIKKDVVFQFSRNTRRRIHHALNGKSKSSSTLDILGKDIETYRKWIEWQFTPEMNWRKIEFYHVKPFCFFDVSKNEELNLLREKYSALIERNS